MKRIIFLFAFVLGACLTSYHDEHKPKPVVPPCPPMPTHPHHDWHASPNSVRYQLKSFICETQHDTRSSLS